MDKRHILVADDDPGILRFLCANLEARGYRVSTAVDGQESLKTVERDSIDLIILDLVMPRLDGLEACQRIREWSQVPIIILSARGDEKDKVRCLKSGADDYLTKPFSIEELVARIETALRHSATSKIEPVQTTFTCGDIEINFATRRVTARGKEVRLTPTEYSLLQVLAVNAGKVLTHAMLLKEVWGNQYCSEREYLHVFTARLRKKLEPDPSHPKYILTDFGIGYHFASLS